MESKFLTKWNRVQVHREILDTTPLDELDDLKPLSLSQSFYRSIQAGEKLVETRRRELMAYNGEVDDPEDLRTPLDDGDDLHSLDGYIAPQGRRVANPRKSDEVLEDKPAVASPPDKQSEKSDK